MYYRQHGMCTTTWNATEEIRPCSPITMGEGGQVNSRET